MLTAFNHGGTINVHKAGCLDISRGENRLWAIDSVDFPSVDAVYENYLDTGDESNPGWLECDIEFFPCTN